MDKRELVEKINKNICVGQSVCKKVVDEMFYIIKDELKKGEEISINNFGKFKLKEVKERLLYLPQKAKFIKIKRKFFPHFKPSKNFSVF